MAAEAAVNRDVADASVRAQEKSCYLLDSQTTRELVP